MNRLATHPVLMPLATAFAIAAPTWQALSRWGLTPAQFSAQGDATLRAAGYAFSIWSLIYAGLLVFAVTHALLARRDAYFARLSWPAALAISGCGAWILASAANARWTTVLIISVSAAAALRAAVLAGRAGALRQRLTTWGLPLVAGWLLIASVVNIVTVATAEGLLSPTASNLVALAAAILVVGVAAGAMWGGASVLYAAPVAWGLVAVFVAERERHPAAAATALVAAVILGALSAIVAWRRMGSHRTLPPR